MASLTKAQKGAIKSYRMWAVLQAKDMMHMNTEYEKQQSMGLHNGHVHELHQHNSGICMKARQEYAEKLGLDN